MATLRDLKISTADGDLALDGQDLATVSDGDAIEQSARVRCQFFRGEHFADQSVGVPFFEVVLVKNPNLAAVREAFRSEVAGTVGIKSVDSLDLRYSDPTARRATLAWAATSDFGQLNAKIEVPK